MKLTIPSHHKFQQGFASLITLIILTVLAVSIPVTTKLVQQNQENRSNAAEKCSCSDAAYGDAMNCSKAGKKWTCVTPVVKAPEKVIDNTAAEKKAAEMIAAEKAIADAKTDAAKTTTSNPITAAADKAVADAKAVAEKVVVETTTKKTCSGGDGNKKCEDLKMYYCNTSTGSWVFASECANGTICNSAKTACVAVPCTSYVYSDWGACINGTKTRTVIGYFPSGCTGIPTIDKILTATCSTTPTTCTYIYSAWGACVDGTQTRNVVSKTPTGCTEGNPILSQECNTCSSSNCGNCGTREACEGKGCKWAGGACMPYTITTAKCGSNDGGSVDHAPVGTEACQNGSISFGDSTAADGTYGWICKVSNTDYVTCSATKTAVTCTYTCDTWGTCLSSGKQSCTSQIAKPDGCTGGVRETTRECDYVPPVTTSKYWFYNGSKCIQTGDSYTSVTLCTNDVRSSCYDSQSYCESAHPVVTYCTYSTGDWSVCKPNGTRSRIITSSPDGCTDTTDKPDSNGTCIYTPSEPPTTIACSSLNCAVCSLSECSKQSGCMVENNGLCTVKKDTVEPQKPSCSISNCSACATSAFCSTAGCYWEMQLKVCTDKIDDVLISNQSSSILTNDESDIDNAYIRSLFEKYGFNVGDEITTSDYKLLQTFIKLQPAVDPLYILENFRKLTSNVGGPYTTKYQLLWNYLTGMNDGNIFESQENADYLILEGALVNEKYGLPDISMSYKDDLMDFIEDNDIKVIIGNKNIVDFYNAGITDNLLSSEDIILPNQKGFVNDNQFPDTIFITDYAVSNGNDYLVIIHELIHILQYHSYGESVYEELGFEGMEFEAYTYGQMSSGTYNFYEGGVVPFMWAEDIMSQVTGSLNNEYGDTTPKYMEALLD